MKKLSVSKIDDDILAEIIGSCEKKMVSPFKKKGVVIDVSEEPEEETEDELESEEKSELKDQLADMDLEDLKKFYATLKD